MVVRRPQSAGRAPNRFRERGREGKLIPANSKASYERYMTLARNAALTDDAVATENFYQHAEHYFRLMREKAT